MKQIFRWSSIAAVILGFSVVIMFAAFAQETVSDEWLDPSNLSQSGGAFDPSMVIDGSGTYHFIWRDAFAGFVYSKGTPNNWQTPVASEFPFIERLLNTKGELTGLVYHRPILVADSADTIHAIWTTTNQTLLYSRVSVADVASSDAWIQPITVAANALTFAAVVDNADQVHLAYARSLDSAQFPAGIYYRQLADTESFNWSESRLLYESRYFRSTEAVDTNITIDSNFDELAIGWDDPIPEKVLAKISNDRGETWGPLREIDGRQSADATDSEKPSDVQMQFARGGLHAVWRAGHNGDSCSLWHQHSADQGAEWVRQEVLPGRFGCAEQFTLLTDSRRQLWLLTEIRDTVYLQLWENNQWSEPLEQSKVKSFNDPERFRLVNLDCQQALINKQELVVVGCDSQPVGRNDQMNIDVWLLRRPLADAKSLFEATPVPLWNEPAEVASSADSMRSPHLLYDVDGNQHVLWVAANSLNLAGENIFYSRVESGVWIAPANLFQSEHQILGEPTFAVDDAQRLYAAWSEGEDGSLYFSQVSLDRAPFANDWLEPVLIPNVGLGANAPKLAVNRDGTIYITYAVSINEARGIYAVTSFDGGVTWQLPVQIFDAEIADWDGVNDPNIVLISDSDVHVTWTRTSILRSVSLHYAYSTDGGLSWSAEQLLAEGNVLGNQLLSGEDQFIHLLSEVESDGQIVLWHRYSNNFGITWSDRARVLATDQSSDPNAVALDADGHLHVVQLSAENRLFHMEWDREQWQTNSSEALPNVRMGDGEVAVSSNRNGLLGFVYAGSVFDAAIEAADQKVLYSDRVILLDGVQPASEPLVTVTPSPTSSVPTATPLPEPTTTPVFNTERVNSDGSIGISNIIATQWSGLILAAASALGFVAIVFTLALRTIRAQRR